MQECYKKNQDLSKKLLENITLIKQLQTDVSKMPSDVDIENLSMVEYKESANKFIKICTALVDQIKTF